MSAATDQPLPFATLARHAAEGNPTLAPEPGSDVPIDGPPPEPPQSLEPSLPDPPDPGAPPPQPLILGRFHSEAEAQAHLERMEADNQRLEDQRLAEARRLDDLIAGRNQPAVPPVPEPPAIGPMPDPIDDPAGHARWAEAKAAQREHEFEAKMEARLAQDQSARQVERMWTEFSSEYPGYAGIPEYAWVEFQDVTSGLRELPRDTTALKREIASRLQQKTGLDPQRGAPPAPPATPTQHRTAGVSAGSSPRPATPTPPPPEDDEGISFVDAIKQLRRKSPLFD